MAEYYGADHRQAKGVSPRHLYGYAAPPTDFANSHVAQISDRVAGDHATSRDMICAYRHGLLEHFSRMGRKSPRSTAFFYVMSQTENDLLNISPNEGPAQMAHPEPKIRARRKAWRWQD